MTDGVTYGIARNGWIILHGPDRAAVIRLSSTRRYKGTPMVHAFGRWAPID